MFIAGSVLILIGILMFTSVIHNKVSSVQFSFYFNNSKQLSNLAIFYFKLFI